jgi:uncharacterized membrane protein
MKDQSEVLAQAVVLAVFLSIIGTVMGVVWVTKSYMEARTFNRVTGAQVSTWDAMWIELRVQEGATIK